RLCCLALRDFFFQQRRRSNRPLPLVALHHYRHGVARLYSRPVANLLIHHHTMAPTHRHERRAKRKPVDRATHRHASLCSKSLLDIKRRTQRRHFAAFHPVKFDLEFQRLHRIFLSQNHPNRKPISFSWFAALGDLCGEEIFSAFCSSSSPSAF